MQAQRKTPGGPIKSLVTPPDWQFDVSVSRNFNIRENKRLEFRAEAYKVLNKLPARYDCRWKYQQRLAPLRGACCPNRRTALNTGSRMPLLDQRGGYPSIVRPGADGWSGREDASKSFQGCPKITTSSAPNKGCLRRHFLEVANAPPFQGGTFASLFASTSIA